MVEGIVEKLERKVAVMARLAEVSAILNSTLQLEPLLTQLLDAAAEITDSNDASVLLWNNKSQELFFAATTSQGSQELIGRPVPLDSIAGEVIRENHAVQVDDAENDPRLYRKVTDDIQYVTRSLLGVPMTYKDRVIGVVEVLNKREPPWTEDDHSNLSILAGQAAVAIETAQMVMTLRRVNEEMAQVDKLKNNFIAIASHELRTPLGVILGYATFLADETTDEAKDHASKVLGSALQLRRIIENMVNLRYLKQSEGELVCEQVSVRELFSDMQGDILTLTNASGHILDVKMPPEDVTLMVDRNRISMALSNLLNNAVEFTPPGGIIGIQCQVQDDNEVWISVTDRGCGLAEENLEMVFKEFFQVEDHMTRRHGGLGIGLSITKALIEAHGGRIWATSEGLGKGSCFTFALPMSS